MKYLYRAPQGAAKALDLGIRSSPHVVARYSYSAALVARADELQQLGDFQCLSRFNPKLPPFVMITQVHSSGVYGIHRAYHTCMWTSMKSAFVP